MAILTGCSEAVPIKDTDRIAAERFIEAEQSPRPVRDLRMWYAVGDPPRMICGTIAAPANLGDLRNRLRYMFFLGTPKPEGAVERHERTVANGALGEQLIAESQRIFDKTWDSACAPLERFSLWRGKDLGGDTPVTNAYIGELLDKKR